MKKMSKVKKVIISVICIIAAAGACCGAAFAIGGKNADTGTESRITANIQR